MPIRKHCPPTDEFITEFQETIVPSAIPSADFIDFDRIEDQIQNYEPQIEAALELQDVSEEQFVEGITDALMQADDTRKWIDFYFELLGERGNKYSATEGLWKFYDSQRAIDSGDREEAQSMADILQEIGLQYIVDRADIRDHYRGMLVGMESHKRKNRQGTCFENLVSQKVERIKDNLSQNGYDISMDDEYKTEYNDDSGQNKVVDFALFEGGDLQVVFEANAYKTGGSKPSEIRRSYNYVAQRMNDDGIAFVWITDGQGWAKSLENVLREAYDDITDLEEHTVVREFSELDRFLSLAEEDGIPDGWESHIVDNAAHTSIPETVDLTAPGTSHVVYFTSEPRVSHRMWMHSDLSEVESKVLSLWFDSSFGLLQMLLTRVPGRGGWTKYRKYTQNRFYTIHPNRLSDEEKSEMMDFFGDFHDAEAPSLVKQMARNVNPKNLTDEQRKALERHFPEAEDELCDGFEPKKTLDETILSVLGFEEDRTKEILEIIYVDLLIELVELKEMME